MQGLYLRPHLWPSCLVSLPLPLRSAEERNSGYPAPGLGEGRSGTEPAGNDGIHLKAAAPSSGTNWQQGIVRTAGMGNHGQRMMIPNTLFYTQHSFSLSLSIV